MTPALHMSTSSLLLDFSRKVWAAVETEARDVWSQGIKVRFGGEGSAAAMMEVAAESLRPVK